MVHLVKRCASCAHPSPRLGPSGRWTVAFYFGIKGLLVEIVPIFHTVFAHVYHYAISELCKGLYHHKVRSDTSPQFLRFTGFDHRRERRRLEYAFLTNAAATVRSVGAV